MQSIERNFETLLEADSGDAEDVRLVAGHEELHQQPRPHALRLAAKALGVCLLVIGCAAAADAFRPSTSHSQLRRTSIAANMLAVEESALTDDVESANHAFTHACKSCPSEPSFAAVKQAIMEEIQKQVKRNAAHYASQKLSPSVKISPDPNASAFQGWGSSLAWWANGVGEWHDSGEAEVLDSLLDLIYSNFTSQDLLNKYLSATPPSLGLTQARYNIGGSPWQPLVDPETTYRAGAAAQSFQNLNGAYNWSADVAQRRVLAGAMTRGVNLVQAFSNSPPWWMTISGSTTGMFPKEVHGHAVPYAGNNLADGNVSAFSNYLAAVCEKFSTDSTMLFGQKLSFDTLSPMNEPGSAWWIYGNTQEGCHMSYDQQALIVNATASALKKVGSETTVAAAEGNKVFQTDKSFNHIEPANVGLITTHGYGLMVNGAYAAWAKPMRKLAEVATKNDKKLWVSEFGTGNGPLQGGLILAKRIIVDLMELKPSSWTLWQVASLHQDLTQEGWAQIVTTYPPAAAAFSIRPQYYAYMHFTAFIRPGSKVLGGCRLCTFSQTDLVMALLPDGKTGVIVAVRMANDLPGASKLFITRPFTFEVAGYSINKVLAAYVTDATQNCTAQPAASLPSVKRGGGFKVSLGPDSITTFLVDLALA